MIMKDTRFKDLSEEEVRAGFFFLIGYLGREHEALQQASQHIISHYKTNSVCR
jgi:hypothetical protein